MNLAWFLIRGSGLAAIALISASMAWGLLVSSKVFGRAVKAKGLQWLHESLSVSAMIAMLVHVFAVSRDEFISLSWFEILVPGASPWEPVAAALGVVAFWVAVAVTGSFYLKKWIGQKAWRKLHYLSFGSFLAGLVHGIVGGTDTSNPWVAGMYAASVITVLLLTAIRMIGGSSQPRASRTTPVRASSSR